MEREVQVRRGLRAGSSGGRAGVAESDTTEVTELAHTAYWVQGFQASNPHALQTQASAAPGPASIFKLFCYN